MKIPQIRCSDVNAVKRIIFLLVLLIPFCLAGCSSDDDEGDNGGEGPNEDAPVSYVLGSGNTNMPSSGTIIAQYADAPVGSEIRRLVDDNADTKYVTYHSSFNITWNGNSSKAVTAYSLTSAADTPEMDPKDWTLYGSNDNTTWTELDAQTNQLFAARKEEKSYEVDNATSYRYYRLSVEANNGGAATQIAEWKLVAMRSYTENINDLIASKGSSTFSAITPMGGQYEYVIGTHLNTDHIHSHIVWNSVSCVDGKKYRSNYKSYVTEIRAVSDELCRKYKLSVIDTENSHHVAKPYAEWLAEKNGQPTWRTAIRQDVDEAIQQSLTWRQFLGALERKGYEVRMGRKYPVLRPPGKERFVRFKTLGKRYTPEAIQTRILYPQFNRCFVENLPRVQYGRLHGGKPRHKLTGLRALYYRYLYELGALPRKPRRPSYAVRQDAYKLDQRIRQMEFLSKHNIDTLAQLETYRQALQTEIGQLLTKRKQLPQNDDVQSQRESVNTALKQLRQEERLCRKIAEHSLEVQQHLTEARRDRAEQQQREQERARDLRPDITTR